VTQTVRRQKTIAREAVVRGVGYLTGADINVRFRPAESNAGVTFIRADLPGRPRIPAHISRVVPRQRRTALQQGEAVVELVEHVMAALSGLRIDNCEIEIDAPEIPGCDGSSLAFVEALGEAGVVEQDKPRETLAIDRPVTVRDGKATLSAHPGEGDQLVLTYSLDYGPGTSIGAQSRFVEISPDSFRHELATSRTFLLESEAKALREAGIGRRTSEADLLVFGPNGPINNELRFPDEPVRHKILDMVGDLALLGKDLAGHVVAHRSGHQLNAELVREIVRQIDSPRGPAGPMTAPVLDISAIMNLLPHRHPFLLVDRVVELEGTERVAAIKNVTYNEPFFVGHWPCRPIMPGVLVLEALAQTAGILMSRWVNCRTHLAYMAAIDDVKMRRPVVPGDQLRLEVEALRTRSRTAEFRALAKVDGQIVVEATFRFVTTKQATADVTAD
jgi:UDP-3-O-[3-hydroxymyristoyl] N-acetylglucosamine deacetylase / 3-hydroxyacyl-[acyl-carrier-protein] dehydratase